MCHLNHYFFINRSRRIEKIYIYTCYLLANPPHKLLPTVEERRKQETIRKQPCQRTGKTCSRKSEDRYKDQTDQCAGNHLKYTGKVQQSRKSPFPGYKMPHGFSNDIDTILFWSIEDLHFSAELMVYLVRYCVSKGDKSLHFIQIKWHWHGMRKKLLLWNRPKVKPPSPKQTPS